MGPLVKKFKDDQKNYFISPQFSPTVVQMLGRKDKLYRLLPLTRSGCTLVETMASWRTR